MADGRAVRFIEGFCRHSKGEWAGQPLRLAPWQRTLVNELMATGPNGLRRHRIGYIGLPRKNGKSTLGAALALYGLLADGEAGAEVYCLDPATRVLTDDLRWVPVGSVAVGDGLASFDEQPVAPNTYRRLRVARVTSAERVVQPTYAISLADGRRIVASAGHLWLGRRATSGGPTGWLRTDRLRPGSRIRDLGPPWQTDDSRDGGYLAGFFDGEGWLARTVRGFLVGAAQRPGRVLDRSIAALRDRGFEPSGPRLHASGVATIGLSGTYETLRFLGSIRPTRLNESNWWAGRTPNQGNGQARVAAIEALGPRAVVAIGTSTATLFVEGLYSHNSCAGDRRQAEIVFSEAKRMVAADPDLAATVRVQRYHLEGPGHAIYRVLSADAALQQGLNPSFVVFDEVHVQPDEDLWNAMTLGSGTRRQPLIVGITTAGFDEASLAYRLYTYGKEVAAGAIDDPTFFFRWWEPPPAGDHRDPATWRAANPALGDFLKLDDFEAAVRTTTESPFQRFRLNQWVAAEHLWLPPGLWESQADPDRELDPKLPLAVGIDPAYSDDTFAVVAAQRQGEDTILRARFFLNPYPPGHSAREDWVVDHEGVRGYLRELGRRFPVAATRIDGRRIAGPAFVYDPSSFTESAQILEGEGMAMLEMPQTDARMVPATRLFYDLLVDRRIWHDGDEILSLHLRNCHAVERGENGWRLRKGTKSSPHKIDGAIAAVMAVAQAAEPAPPPRMRAFVA